MSITITVLIGLACTMLGVLIGHCLTVLLFRIGVRHGVDIGELYMEVLKDGEVIRMGCRIANDIGKENATNSD